MGCHDEVHVVGHGDGVGDEPASGRCGEPTPCGKQRGGGGVVRSGGDRREAFVAVEVFFAGGEILALERGELRGGGFDGLEVGVDFAHAFEHVGGERAGEADGDEVRSVGNFPMRQAMAPAVAGCGEGAGQGERWIRRSAEL